jgi:prepilin-type N-terminal cleavage/methylation domain-containing protein
MPPHRRAFTLLELLLCCAIIGIATGIAAPRVHATLDAFAVEGAARETINVFALARLAALRSGGASVQVDTLTLTLNAGGRTVLQRNIAQGNGVHMRVTMSQVRYAATGLGVGVSNGTIYLTRGAAAETVVVSRLGRARR